MDETVKPVSCETCKCRDFCDWPERKDNRGCTGHIPEDSKEVISMSMAKRVSVQKRTEDNAEAILKLLEIYANCGTVVSQGFYQGLCNQSIGVIKKLQDEVRKLTAKPNKKITDLKRFADSFARVIEIIDPVPNSQITEENKNIKVLADWGRNAVEKIHKI